MNTPRLLLLAAVSLGGFVLFGAETPAASGLKKLFDPNLSAGELEKAVAEAARDGVSKQAVAEARLVWGLRHQDTDYLEKALPELEAAAKNFKKEDSAGWAAPRIFSGC